ncbi:hypothetical protein BGK67_31305 [Streptomyces subrutilus]|uniref:AMP-dependent synthetase/ligase domain-containing protein n=1 Tax=Streptomyces subrutilus TaxID=36818 RepID=A0A1E5Q0A6_9ACTN|nr:hypothetical protein BGK67_31305 [Streptomyces subrutilus]
MAVLGVVRTGAAYLPIDGHAPADRVTAVLNDSGAQAVIVGRGAERRPRPFGTGADTPVLTVPAAAGAQIVEEVDTASPGLASW